MDGHYRFGTGTDLRFHVLWVKVEGTIDLCQDGHGAGVDDGRDTGDKGEAGDDHLVAGTDAQRCHRGQEGGCAGVDGHCVLDLRQGSDLLLQLVDLALEARVNAVGGRYAIAVEIACPQNLEDFLYLFFTDQFHAGSGHSCSP